MEFNDESAFSSTFPPSLVYLTPFKQHSISSLSTHFTEPKKPTFSARKQLSWLSFQGRLVGAEEATCAKTVDKNGTFSVKEQVGWDLLSPIERVLAVAVVGAASVKSEKNNKIFKLQKSVELRDQILLSMQQKLDNLCDQVNYFKDNPEVVYTAKDVYAGKRDESACWSCKRHSISSNNALDNTPAQGSNGDEMLKYRMSPDNVTEPEERRMSDLSDWAPSVTSSVDIQPDSLIMEHDIISLRKECEEKDIAIEKLSKLIQATEVSGSKRTAELEDIIRRKNMINNKLRKDILTLEQKTIHLTRLRRKSFSDARSTMKQTPLLTDNVLYDMDNTTSPSSSDSDSPRKNQTRAQESESQAVSNQHNKRSSKAQESESLAVPTQLNERSSKADQKHVQFRSSTSPLKERSLNRTPDSSVPASNANHSVAMSGENRSRRRPTARIKETAMPKRWV